MKKALILLVTLVAMSCSRKPEIVENRARGEAQGTTYHITYLSDEEMELKSSFDSIFRGVDNSMSTYNPNSLISKVNAGGEPVEVDAMFRTVLSRSIQVAGETGGLFDPTVGPLVEVWGFGKKVHMDLDSLKVDSAKAITGFYNVRFTGAEVSVPQGFRIDFNAIAQGYTVDLVSQFLEGKGVERYMVEVGGEVRARGLNIKNEPWRIGVDKPTEEIDEEDRFQIIIGLENMAMATSGNYRKFWVDRTTGMRYAHTIDPKTGYPAKNRLLSVTLLAKNCMDADAYATACMVMGTEKALNFLNGKEDIEGYLIYTNDDGEWEVTQTEGFEQYIVQDP